MIRDHVFPQKFGDEFAARGVNINDPRYGAWWGAELIAAPRASTIASGKASSDARAAHPRAMRSSTSVDSFRGTMASHQDSDHLLECSDAFALGEGPEGLGHGGKALRVRSCELLHNSVELTRAEERPLEPIEFVRDEGRKPHDLIGTTYATLVLVSERFLDVLREREFNGWATFPARVLDDGVGLDGYHGFAVTGRCGPIDDSLGEDVTLPPPFPQGRSRRGLRGLCFPPDSWDGSDVFTSDDGGAMIFVTAAVKQALEGAGITNIELRRLSEIERTWRADGSLIESGS